VREERQQARRKKEKPLGGREGERKGGRKRGREREREGGRKRGRTRAHV
jgi:hypothetical protein